ncbi:type III secretion system stator protein SctL [Trinickia terrae]|nr:type III secretion system stator protein SctL [Trinickia terrae]
MAIWLKNHPQVVAVDTDVVRAGELARVIELSDAVDALHELVAATMSDATERARALVEKARLEADGFVAAARRKFNNSARLGYAAGNRRALAEVHARYLARLRREEEELRTSADRLSRIVMKAIEQVVAESDRDALMRRVALTVGRALDDATHLTVIVPPSDAERAQRLFGELSREASPPLNVEVIVNDDAPEGTCTCDWDYGVIEADLSAQLAGLSRAISKGAELEDWPDGDAAGYVDADDESGDDYGAQDEHTGAA